MNILDFFKYDPYRSREYRAFEQAVQTLIDRMFDEDGFMDEVDLQNMASLIRKMPGVILARPLGPYALIVMLATGREDIPATWTSFRWGGPHRLRIKRPPLEDPIALNCWVEDILLT